MRGRKDICNIIYIKRNRVNINLLPLCLTVHHAMKTYEDVVIGLSLLAFLTSTLDVDELLPSRLCRFNPKEVALNIH
jgi:hypothetical protein